MTGWNLRAGHERLHVVASDSRWALRTARLRGGIAVLAAVLAVGCSSSDGSKTIRVPPESDASWNRCATTIARHPHDILVASPAADSTVRLRVGARLPLSLTEAWPFFWDPAVSDSPSVVSIIDQTGGYPIDCQYTATLLANNAGTAHIASQTDVPCLHARKYACKPAQKLWRMTVIVSP